MKCSIKEALLFKGFFFFVFVFKFIDQFCFNYIMTSIILLSIKVHKSCENVSFCFCTDKKDVANNVYEVDQELGGGELSLFVCPGWGIDLQERKKLQIPGGVPGGGHDYL